MSHLRIVSALFIILYCSSAGYSTSIYSRVGKDDPNKGEIEKVSAEQDSLKYSYRDTTITYTVKPGDNLWEISTKKLGDGFGWSEIYDINKNRITNSYKIYPGQKLKIKLTFISIQPRIDTLQNLANHKDKINKATHNISGMQHTPGSESLGIGGLVIDRTQSKWGRDFVDLFNKNFNPPAFMNDYTIVIEEKPLPRFGTVILIKVNGNYIFQKFIQPRYETIKTDAEKGTQMALSYLANYQQIQKELQGEDLKGTGIY